MTDNEGHDLVNTIYRKIIVHPDFAIETNTTVSHDKVNGHMYSFTYRRKKLSDLEHHVGEVEEFEVAYMHEENEVWHTFINNGCTFVITDAEMFNS